MDIVEISDRLEIRQLMDLYALACDGCDFDLFRKLFTADAVLDYTEFNGKRQGLEETITWLSGGLPNYAGLHHNMTNHYCEISGKTAKAITYFIAYHTNVDGAGGETMMEVGGFYKDRLVKQADGWRISERADLGMWIKPPLPPRMTAPPKWYGTKNHHRPWLLED